MQRERRVAHGDVEAAAGEFATGAQVRQPVADLLVADPVRRPVVVFHAGLPAAAAQAGEVALDRARGTTPIVNSRVN